MKRLLHTPLALLVWRIALLYAALMLCRAAFWVYNAALLGPPEWSELGQLVAGSLKFDTASVPTACSSCCRSCPCTCANGAGTGACCSGIT